MTLVTPVSLPGIGCELRMTVSFSWISSQRLSPEASRARADIGSPCEPVEITHTSPGGRPSMSSMSMSTESGMRNTPSLRARATFFFIDRPRVATRRPKDWAASATCWTRWMWEAKQVTIRRRPSWACMTLYRTAPTEVSDREWPGESALVESDRRRRMPSFWAMAPIDAEVGEAAVDRVQVQLEVAGVQDRALRGVDGGGEAVGHRVGDGEELAVERADLQPLVVGHDPEVGAVDQARLLDAVPGQAQGQLGAVDRELQLPEQERQAADVVLVAVGGDAADHAVGVLPQVGEVGQDEVDARACRCPGT